jgi:hypothetical protein
MRHTTGIRAISVGTAIMIGSFRERALKNSERQLENTTQLLAVHFEQLLRDFEAVQITVGRQMQVGVDSPRGPQAADVGRGHPCHAEVENQRIYRSRRRQSRRVGIYDLGIVTAYFCYRICP